MKPKISFGIIYSFLLQEVLESMVCISLYTYLLAHQAAFIPSAEAHDTSYFMSRYIWNPEEENVRGASDFDSITETDSPSCSSGSFSAMQDEDVSFCLKYALLTSEKLGPIRLPGLVKIICLILHLKIISYMFYLIKSIQHSYFLYVVLISKIMFYYLKQVDECGNLADFGGGPTLDVKYSFSNFSFKVSFYVAVLDKVAIILSC